MTYKDFVDMIKASATSVNPSGYYLNAHRTADAQTHFGEASPQIFSCKIASTRNPKTGVRTFNCLLLFVDQDAPASSEQEREGLKDRMDQLCTLFLNHLDDNNANISYTTNETPEDRSLTGVYTGWSVSLNVSTQVPC